MITGRLSTDKTWTETIADLRDQFRKWGVRDILYPILRDAQRNMGGVTIKWVPKGQSAWTEISCGTFGQPETNIRAIYLAISNVRLMEQRGIGRQLAQASAHLALPAPAGAKPTRTPQEVLGIVAGMTPKQMIDQFKTRELATHPDRGGNADEFKAVRAAGEKLGLV